MKRIINVLGLSLLMLLTAVPTSAYDFNFDDISYDIIEGTNEVRVMKGGRTNTVELTIPEEVTNDGTTYRVTEIGESAFSSCRRMTSITLPKSIKKIGKGLLGSPYLSSYRLAEVHISDIAAWCDIEFEDFSANPLFRGASLYLNEEQITDLVIPDGITSIKKYAFYGCGGLTSVDIPNSVTSMGTHAFSGCENMTAVYIHDLTAWFGIEFNLDDEYNGYIGKYYYSNASNPLYCAHNLYLNGEKITELVIPENITSIGNGTFMGFSGMTSVTIPNNITSIGKDAFHGCDGLTSITIPNSVTSIGNRAFADCDGLTSVTIPNSVTSVNEGVFAYCDGLTSITIPSSVTSIKKNAFYECPNLTAVNINDLAAWCGIDTEYKDDMGFNTSNPLVLAHNLYLNGEKITDLVIPDGVTSIGNYTFMCCTGFTSVTIPNSVTSIGTWAFDGCSNLTAVHINDLAAWCNIDFSTPASNPLLIAPIYQNGKKVTDLVIPDGVTRIKYSAFYGCTSLTSVSFPNSLTEIGKYAFHGCTGLTTLDIPNSITRLEQWSFDGCPNLKTVNIHDMAAWCNIHFMGREANPLSYIHNLSLNGENVTNLVIPEGVTSINHYAFSGCNGITSVELPKSLTNIGIQAFFECTSLTQITIPSNVTYIGRNAFQGCEYLTSVTFEDGETPLYLQESLFYNVPLETVYLGRNASGVEGSPFGDTAETTNHAGVTIGNTVTELGNSLFANWKNLVHVSWDFQCRVTSIGSNTFNGCTGLYSAPIPQSVTSIGDHAFRGCTGLLYWIYIPDGVKSIGDYAFYGCTSAEAVYIPSSITSIGASAFEGCTGLTKVHIKDLTAWCNIDFQVDFQENGRFTNPLYYAHNLYLNDEKVTDLVIPDGVTAIKRYAFAACSGLTSITIPNSVTAIERFAFGSCDGLTLVTIPENVTSIGKYAFSYCTGLTSVTMSNGLKEIQEGAFNNCAGLTTITIPNSVTSIGVGAFRRCSGLTSVYSLNTVPPTVDSYCFDDAQYQTATLYVPRTALETYRTTDPWLNFVNMEGIDVSGIKGINADGCGKRNVYYDLNGRKLNEPKVGLNIINGKKVVVK